MDHIARVALLKLSFNCRDLQLSMSDVSAKAVITGEIYPTLLILLRFVKYLQRKQHSFVPDLPKASFNVNYKSVFQARQTLMLCKCGKEL